MSKKYKKGKQPPKETTIENFYDLKTKEMDELGKYRRNNGRNSGREQKEVW